MGDGRHWKVIVIKCHQRKMAADAPGVRGGSMKKVKKFLLGRATIVALAILVQLCWLLSFLYGFQMRYAFFNTAIDIAAIFVVLLIVNKRSNLSYKIAWTVVILAIPIVGLLLYFIFGRSELTRPTRKRMEAVNCEIEKSLPEHQDLLEELMEQDLSVYRQSKYVREWAGYPVYKNTETQYYPSGEKMFPDLLQALEEAEHFIFMEYFIVDEGIMWGRILEILARKAKLGVDVRVMYDGSCEFALLPHDYPKRLEAFGIQCKVFAGVTPFVSTHYNYRDHRKILVVDGHTAFNGGVNLADEYINQKEKFGHWKDTAVMLKGEAAKSFTLMFLQMWELDEAKEESSKFLSYPTALHKQAEGYVIPYGDCPLDNDKLGERVYMDILNRSLEYVHIMTPYLILDGELETALKFAAERGVEVALVLPGIPDKAVPYALAKTHYASLLESWVKIYEYTPGFVHAKVFVSDGVEAVVGTINLDYRSLYHHFECATYLYRVGCIGEIEADFQDTIAKSRQVTKETVRREKWQVKLTGRLMKAIAPLM